MPVSHSHTYSNGTHTWFVRDLHRLSEELPIVQKKLSDFKEWDEAVWDQELTIRQFAEHMKRVQDADLKYPILLSEDGWIMDGAHRLVKAFFLGWVEIPTRQFKTNPPPSDIKSP